MASAQLKQLYRTARRANVGCIVGESALSAWRAARILRQWAALEDMGAVRLIAIPDEDCDASDYSDDPDDEAFGVVGQYRTDFDAESWDASDTDRGDGTIRDYRHTFTAEWREIRWEQGDSIWGCVGCKDVLDWRENAYVIDIMEATIDVFRAAWKAHVRARRDRQAGLCTACHGTGRVA